MTILNELFKLPTTLSVTRIPTDEDPRGYIEIPALGNNIRLGEDNLVISDMAEFQDSISFTLDHKLSVAVSLIKEGGKNRYNTVVINDDNLLLLNSIYATRKDLYMALKGICGTEEKEWQ